MKGNVVMVAYVDSIIIIETGKSIGLNINEDTTKNLIILRKQHCQNSISVGDMAFEKIPNFKYLKVDINERANSYEVINQRVTVVILL